MLRSAVFFVLVSLVSCGVQTPLKTEFETLGSQKLLLGSAIAKHEASALFFLSPDCPLCQNYSVTIDKVQEKFEKENVAFYGVLSGNYYTDSEMEGYLIRYGLDLPILLDPHFRLADYYNATITPEVVVIDGNGETLYQGAIDNWAISLGQKRLTITEHYLDNALSAHLLGKPIEPVKTKAIGCFIE